MTPDIKNFTKLFDLEYYDGPLLSLFADSKGGFYLYKWYDVNNFSHQWLVFKVGYDKIVNYVNKNIPEYYLLDNDLAKRFYLVEFNEKGMPNVTIQMSKKDVLVEYKQTNDVYFDYLLCPHWNAIKRFFIGQPRKPQTLKAPLTKRQKSSSSGKNLKTNLV